MTTFKQIIKRKQPGLGKLVSSWNFYRHKEEKSLKA